MKSPRAVYRAGVVTGSCSGLAKLPSRPAGAVPLRLSVPPMATLRRNEKRRAPPGGKHR